MKWSRRSSHKAVKHLRIKHAQLKKALRTVKTHPANIPLNSVSRRTHSSKRKSKDTVNDDRPEGFSWPSDLPSVSKLLGICEQISAK